MKLAYEPPHPEKLSCTLLFNLSYVLIDALSTLITGASTAAATTAANLWTGSTALDASHRCQSAAGGCDAPSVLRWWRPPCAATGSDACTQPYIPSAQHGSTSCTAASRCWTDDAATSGSSATTGAGQLPAAAAALHDADSAEPAAAVSAVSSTAAAAAVSGY